MRSEQRSSSGSSELTRMTPLPRGGQVVDDAVDVLLGADVDAAGGVVEEEDVGIAQQPAGEQDLLLVAAAEGADRRRRETRTSAPACRPRGRARAAPRRGA